MKKLLLLMLLPGLSWAQTLSPLTVEKIMRDPKWIGVAPTNVFWSEDGKQLYFNWNPDKNAGDSLYVITATNQTPQKVSPAQRRALPLGNGAYNKLLTKKVFEKNGDIFLLDIASGKVQAVTQTLERESNPEFS